MNCQDHVEHWDKDANGNFYRLEPRDHVEIFDYEAQGDLLPTADDWKQTDIIRNNLQARKDLAFTYLVMWLIFITGICIGKAL